jgi:hypothetical protein
MRPDPVLPPDSTTLLARAIVADAASVGLSCTIAMWRSHPWASATFTGTRHDAVLAIGRDGDPAAWLTALPDRDLTMRGHLLADLTATRRPDGTVGIDALTIEAI